MISNNFKEINKILTILSNFGLTAEEIMIEILTDRTNLFQLNY